MYKKSILSVALATILLGTILSNSASAGIGKDLQMIPVIVNGQKVKFPDTEPYINTDGRTMVPVRFVSEKLGAEVKWEVDTETAIIDFEGKTIRMPVGSKTVTVDGQAQELDTAAESQDGRTMVPLRFVSEVLGSKVEWDDPAHAVRVTDAKYQAKVDSGEVKLDPWGREYKDQDGMWILTDLESTSLYDQKFLFPEQRKFLEGFKIGYKQTSDILSNKIREWYEAQLNVDYRTIIEKELIAAFIDNATSEIYLNPRRKAEVEKVIKEYVEWVKKNKVIVKGYADPEFMAIFPWRVGLGVTVPTRFKFMVVSAEDTAQVFMDNWRVSDNSDSYKLKKGIWYDGYASVLLSTNYANTKYGEVMGLRSTENMFVKGTYDYKTLTP